MRAESRAEEDPPAPAERGPRALIPVSVIAYDPCWSLQYAEEAASICAFLPLELHHIGSTSVEGCCAKPVIDIMGVCRRDADRQKLCRALSELGYEFLGDYGVAGRDFYFRYSAVNYHLSIFEPDNPSVEANLRFRERLQTDKAFRAEYISLKQRLANEHNQDMAAYSAGKSDLIRSVL